VIGRRIAAIDQHGFVVDVNATADVVFDNDIISRLRIGGFSFAIPSPGRSS